jgi:hypothetical protein
MYAAKNIKSAIIEFTINNPRYDVYYLFKFDVYLEEKAMIKDTNRAIKSAIILISHGYLENPIRR